MIYREPAHPRSLYHADNDSDFGGESYLDLCPCCLREYGEHTRDCANFANLDEYDDDALEALCATVDVDAINEVTP